MVLRLVRLVESCSSECKSYPREPSEIEVKVFRLERVRDKIKPSDLSVGKIRELGNRRDMDQYNIVSRFVLVFCKHGGGVLCFLTDNFTCIL